MTVPALSIKSLKKTYASPVRGTALLGRLWDLRASNGASGFGKRLARGMADF